MTNMAPLPCDRGIPNNAQTRGWHNFQVAPGTRIPVCTFCGMTRSDITAARDRLIQMSWHPDLEKYEMAAANAMLKWSQEHLQGPTSMKFNTHTAAVLASRSGDQGLSVQDGGTLMGVPFEINDDLKDMEFSVEGSDVSR